MTNFWVALKAGAELAECFEFFDREIAGVSHGDVANRNDVSIA